MTFDRANPDQIKQRLSRTSSQARKALGQHFLINRDIIRAIISVRLLNGERVVEIGPGPGILTEALLEQKVSLTAFELDPIFIDWLHEDFPKLNLIAGSVLDQALTHLPKSPYKIVANIPYGITNPLLRLFLEGSIARPTSMTLLVQYEIAERLAAAAGHTGRGFLSVLAQHCADVRLIRAVPAEAFWPPPKVRSAIVDLQLHPEIPEDSAQFLHFVRRSFTAQRKQLKNVLAGIRGVPTATITDQFQQLGLPETVRAQQLTLEQWRALYEAGI